MAEKKAAPAKPPKRSPGRPVSKGVWIQLNVRVTQSTLDNIQAIMDARELTSQSDAIRFAITEEARRARSLTAKTG